MLCVQNSQPCARPSKKPGTFEKNTFREVVHDNLMRFECTIDKTDKTVKTVRIKDVGHTKFRVRELGD